MNFNLVPSKEHTLQRFMERFPTAMKNGWRLEQSYPDYEGGEHLYRVAPPKDSPIESWATHVPRNVSWAGMEIDIPQTFWDDDLLVNHGK